MSFRLGIKPTRRAAARFITRSRRKLQQAAQRAAERGISQSDIAREIGVHRSLISRELNGEANMSMGRYAEIVHAMGGELDLEITFPADDRGRNAPAVTNGITVNQIEIGGPVQAITGTTGAVSTTRRILVDG